MFQQPFVPQQFAVEQCPVKVLTFQELSCEPIQQEMLGVLAQQIDAQFMQDRKAWQAHFDAITCLRTINKQYPIFVNQLFEKFGQTLLACMDEVKPYILRNTIFLLTEVVRNGAQIQLNENILKYFVPKIALKSQTADSKIIKEDCLVCMSEFVMNCLSDTSINVVLGLIPDDKHKTPSLQLFALRMLAKQLESLNQNFKALKQETLQALVITLAVQLDSKRLDIQNYGYQIFMFIYNLIGQDSFLMMLSTFLNVQQREEVIKLLQQKNQKFNKRTEVKVSARKSMIQRNKENNMTDQFIPQFAVGQSTTKMQYWVDGHQQPPPQQYQQFGQQQQQYGYY